ncbi:hypothetical protein Taro_004963 [Colocasia esculenta]|uniref:Uncharacterized protein n=1 Tax=Colocasia esculenta TaxID=4460 RepID=A0A843TT44_COLES|nr:hypothetical protein [Colocasia esculenta]
MVGVSACAPGQGVPLGPSGGNAKSGGFYSVCGVPVSQAVPCVPALADGPSGGFQKGCRVCLCLLGLSWLQAICAISVGGCLASSPSPGAWHLRASPRDWLLPFSGTPIPTRLYQRVLLQVAGVLKSRTWSRRGKWWGQWREPFVSEVVQALIRCGPASPSHCLALRWFRSHVGRSGMGPQFERTTAPNCYFCNPFLGAVHGGTGVCSSLTSWSARGAGWFCLWALDLVETLSVCRQHWVLLSTGASKQKIQSLWKAVAVDRRLGAVDRHRQTEGLGVLGTSSCRQVAEVLSTGTSVLKNGLLACV